MGGLKLSVRVVAEVSFTPKLKSTFSGGGGGCAALNSELISSNAAVYNHNHTLITFNLSNGVQMKSFALVY